LEVLEDDQGEEFDFTTRIREKSTGIFYAIDEENSVFKVFGEKAPLLEDVEYCDLAEDLTWDPETETLIENTD
jgi:hypothetical protein